MQNNHEQRIIMHVDMDAFFASCEEAVDSSLKGKPVIIGSDPKEGKGRGVVSTSNYESRKYGIHSAMPISQAYKRCPNGIYLRGNFELYSKLSRQVMLILRFYSTRFQQVSIDEAYLDVTEKAPSLEEAKQLAKKIKQQIKQQTKLTCSVGIATNKLIAKIASDHNKPDGITVVQNNKEFLNPLPIRKLRGIGKKTEPKIKALGINTIGDLARYSKEKLIERFGAYGLYLSLSASGQGSDFVGSFHERSSISKERTFMQDQTDFNEIYKTIKAISEKIHEKLIEENFVFKTVSIKIRLHDFKTYNRSHTFHTVQNNKNTIQKTAIGLTKEFEGKKIRLIGVRVSSIEKWRDQKNLLAYC